MGWKSNAQWFDIDKKGLAKILARKGKGFAALELLQNAWDQNVTRVEIQFEKLTGSRDTLLSVKDDDPDGFSNLAHAFTLFAESEKTADPGKRGRFNLGEKLVLALCDEASIETTKGMVQFDREGRRQNKRVKRKEGSVFRGRIQMTVAEFKAALATLGQVIPPAGIETRLNGELIPSRTPVRVFETTLPTEIADEEGYLKRSSRKTTVRIYDTREGETATLFEMGIPVVQTGDTYHIDVQQKVPLSLERDNVRPSYLQALRAAVLNQMHEAIDEDNASSAWVRDALADPRCASEAATSAIKARFGNKAVAYDPSDPEANKIAVSKGYVVVHGGALSKGEWDNVKKAGVLSPAGQVTPSAKAFSDDPTAPTLKLVAEAEWSEDERGRVEQIKRIATVLIGSSISVQIAHDRGWRFDGAYGGRAMTLNRARLGKQWFVGELSEDGLALVIHELGHEFSGDHLSSQYHEALCSLGARLARAVKESTELI